MTKCKFCDWEGTTPVAHMSECIHAPEEAREGFQTMLHNAPRFKAIQTCCKLRKKVMLKPMTLPEEYCGISDTEVLDVSTFEKFEEMDVLIFRFCPWCGAKWVPMGVMVT